MASAIGFAAISAPALAQESFYREMTVDGRIYVFASEQNLKAYEASKELAVGTITRPGYGPNGETVVFDGPKAVEAFNTKYGKTDAPPQETKTPEVKLPFNVQYRMPGLRLTFPKFELSWVNRAQFRYTYENPDTNAPQSNKGSFRIPRFRMKWDGWIYTKELTYELQIDVAQVSSTGTNVLQDANLNYDFTGGTKAFQLKIGQFKAPFSQQQLTSSGNQQFVDRSITDAFFVPGRQLGLQLWGQVGPTAVPDMIDWRFGLFNGNGRTVAANDNDKHEYVARLAFSPFGSPGYSEANLEAYDFRLMIAGEYNNNDRIVTTPTPTGSDIDQELGGSIVIKAAKILFLYG
ncbi:MAG: porin, partial [Thermoanaerobaculia bacterium]